MNVYPAIRNGQDEPVYILTMSAREVANRVHHVDSAAAAAGDDSARQVTALRVAVTGGNPRWWPADDALATGAVGLLSFDGDETLSCLDAPSRLAALRWATSKANPNRDEDCRSDIIVTLVTSTPDEPGDAGRKRLLAALAGRA
jgi:hypothetical protein